MSVTLSIAKPRECDCYVWVVWIDSGMPFVPDGYGYEASRQAAMDAAKRWLAAQGITQKPQVDRGHGARWWVRRTGTPASRDARAPEPIRIDALHKEYLTALGLEKMPVSEKQLTWAWREAAKSKHPDAGGSDAEFIAAKNAYEHLREYVQGGAE